MVVRVVLEVLMQAREKIVKSTWNLVQSVKDAVTSNVTNAVKAGQIRVDQHDMQKLVDLVSASVDEGYERAQRAHARVIDSTFELPSAKKNSH